MDIKKVLLIEDSNTEQTLLRSYLTDLYSKKLAVICATTGEDAKKLFAQHQDIDLILLDYFLPDTEGLQLLVYFQAKYSNFPPVIILTGEGDERIAADSIKSGAMDYLSKKALTEANLDRAITKSRYKYFRQQQEKQKIATNQFLAYHDPLTKIANQRKFYKVAEQAILRAKRNKQRLAICMIDFDNFKGINDNYGHLVGDELLKQFTKRVIANLRESDVFARFAGDEFLLLAEDIKNIKDTDIITGKLLDSVKDKFICENKELTLTISVGLVLYPDNGDTLKDLINRADIALYKAKDLGKNQAYYFKNIDLK